MAAFVLALIFGLFVADLREAAARDALERDRLELGKGLHGKR
jgi:hypothetical protein